MLLQGIFLGIAIGVVLGVVGAGGAILAVPGLIAVMGLSATAATTSSLVIVGASALAGVLPRIKKSQVDVKLGVIFSLLGVAGTFIGTRLVTQVPEHVTWPSWGSGLTPAAAIRTVFDRIPILSPRLSPHHLTPTSHADLAWQIGL